MKDEKKDLRSNFSPLDLAKLRGKQIKKSGHKIWSIPKLGVKRIKESWHKMKDWAKQKRQDFEEYVSEERNAIIDKKVSKIDDKIDDINNAKDALQSSVQDDKDREEIEPYIQIADEKLKKLESKKVKVSSKGMGVFSLSRLALKKISTKGIHKAQEKLSKVAKAISGKARDIKNNIGDEFRDMAAARQQRKEIRDERRTFNQVSKEISVIADENRRYYDAIQKLQQQINENNQRISELNDFVNGYFPPAPEMDAPDAGMGSRA